jgi:hypothetical protein
VAQLIRNKNLLVVVILRTPYRVLIVFVRRTYSVVGGWQLECLFRRDEDTKNTKGHHRDTRGTPEGHQRDTRGTPEGTWKLQPLSPYALLRGTVKRVDPYHIQSLGLSHTGGRCGSGGSALFILYSRGYPIYPCKIGLAHGEKKY